MYDISSLFSILELPSLKHLEFNSDAQYLKKTSLEALLPRVNTLERFITEPQFFAQGHYMKCLSHMSSLTHISIRWTAFLGSPGWSVTGDNNNDNYRAISDALLLWFTTPDSTGDYPVSALEIFECHAMSEFTDNALVDFIRNKYSLPGIRALSRISITFSRPQTVDIIEAIGEEISKDLDHYLKYPYPIDSLDEAIAFNPFSGIQKDLNNALNGCLS